MKIPSISRNRAEYQQPPVLGAYLHVKTRAGRLHAQGVTREVRHIYDGNVLEVQKWQEFQVLTYPEKKEWKSA
mgnify:CR=1 FL=1